MEFYRKDDGMRLKQVEGPMVVHSNRSQNIHDNGLDKEYNRIVDTGGKLSSLQLIQGVKWEEEFNNTSSLASNEIYRQNITNSPPSQLSFLLPPSPVNSLADDEEGPSFTSPESEESPSLSQSSDSDSLSEVPPTSTSRRGIVNPNYPGFQHFASQLHSPSEESEDDRDSGTLDTVNSNNVSNNNNNENFSESLNQLNQLDTGGFQKPFYDKPKFNLPLDSEQCNFNEELDKVSYLVEELNIPVKELWSEKMVDIAEDPEVLKESNKMADAFLSGVKEEIQKCEDTNRAVEEVEKGVCEMEELEVPRKKEKMELNLSARKGKVQPANLAAQQPPANMTSRVPPSRRRSMEKKKSSPEILGGFDVYNIETAMPTIDLDAIENHLKAAREEERRGLACRGRDALPPQSQSRSGPGAHSMVMNRYEKWSWRLAKSSDDRKFLKRRNDREEIRKRLATGCDGDEYYGGDRPGRKPSLQARLQSGMNLQICFMNDTMSDTESPSSDSEATAKVATPVKQPSPLAAVPDTKLSPRSPKGGMNLPLKTEPLTEADFFAEQARLQSEARLALAQAKDLARLQMEMERQRRQVSPITEMLKTTLLKVGVVFPQDRRRVSRQMLTDMNVAQLQVIVNDLHTQIEFLNESLVKLLMERDDLHMTQDSMLVDIEDLTRYLGAKENTFKEDISLNNNLPPTKPKQNRVAGRK